MLSMCALHSTIFLELKTGGDSLVIYYYIETNKNISRWYIKLCSGEWNIPKE